MISTILVLLLGLAQANLSEIPLGVGKVVSFGSGEQFQIMELLGEGKFKRAYRAKRLGCVDLCQVVISYCVNDRGGCFNGVSESLYQKIRNRPPRFLKTELGSVEARIHTPGVETSTRARVFVSEYAPYTLQDLGHQFGIWGASYLTDLPQRVRGLRAVAEQLNLGLQDLKDLGHTHNDIKVANIFVRTDLPTPPKAVDFVEGRATLAIGDFDAVDWIDSGSRNWGVRSFFGPERGTGPYVAHPSSDTYLVGKALGGMAFNHIDHSLPASSLDIGDGFRKAIQVSEDRHPEVLEDLRWLKEQINFALARDPDHRRLLQPKESYPSGENPLVSRNNLPRLTELARGMCVEEPW